MQQNLEPSGGEIEDVKNRKKVKKLNKKYEIKLLSTGECGDRTEPGIFYDGNDLAWRKEVPSTLVVLICAGPL